MTHGSPVRKIGALAGLAAMAALLTAGGCEEDVGEGDQPGIYTVRVSVNAFGGEVRGTTNGSEGASLSFDGNLVAFHSDSGELVGSDGFSGDDVFVKNRLTGAVELISQRVNTFDPTPLGPSINPSLSRDGRFVALESLGQLVSGSGTNSMIYRFDRTTGQMRGLFGPGAPANADMTRPAISADGRWIAFRSAATNLVGGLTYPTPGAVQIYVADMQPFFPVFHLISRSAGSATTAGDAGSGLPQITPSGGTIVFDSMATNLGGGVPVLSDVFAVDFDTTTFAVSPPAFISRSSAGTPGNEPSISPAVSSNGNLVIFSTYASNLGPPTGDVNPGIVLHDRLAGTTTVVGLNESGGILLNCFLPVISDDGSMIAWQGPPSGTFGVPQIWARNLLTGQSQKASVNIRGEIADVVCRLPSISGNGRVVAWDSIASNLVTVDTNGLGDVFVRTPLK